MYNEEHGVTIGHYHSWKHWHLIPVSRPVINPPTERTNLVTVAGMDGSWDLSQAVAQRRYTMTGRVRWNSTWKTITGTGTRHTPRFKMLWVESATW